MQLKMKLTYFSRIRDFKSLKSSAMNMGMLSFLLTSTTLILIHILFFQKFNNSSSIWFPLLLVGVGIAAFIGTSFLKENSYTASNPLFHEISTFLNSLFEQKYIAPPLSTAFKFNGPKLLKLDKSKPSPNIIFIFLESFGQKATSAKSTPNFEKLKQEGFFFSNFYSNGTLTYRAILSSLFGVPPRNKAEGLKPYVNSCLVGLPEILKNHGYRTSFQQSGSLCFDWQKHFLEKHFDEIYDHYDFSKNPCSGWGIEDEFLIRHSVNWLEKQIKPAFLTLFTISNHHPWIPIEGHITPSFDLPLNSPKERFLKTVHYTDHCLGLFVDLLREKKLNENTILFILADHGQPMGEHQNNFCNSRFLFEENIHIPLLVIADGKIDLPKEINNLSSQADLMPTVLDLLNIDVELPHIGDSLLREKKDKTLFMQNPYSEGHTALRKGSWKWIENDLYNIETDPYETQNLAEVYPELAKELKLEALEISTSIDNYYEQLSEKDSPLYPPIEFNFSESLICDRELINKVSNSIRRIKLQNCLMLSDQGISALFQKCPLLERIHLSGLTHITDALFEKGAPKSLQKIDLSSAHQISDKGLILLTLASPFLSELSLNGRNLTDNSISRLGPHLSHFKLYEGPHIEEVGFINLLKKNKQLHRLVLDNCPKVTDQVILSLKDLPLEQLWIRGPSKITNKSVFLLENLPLRSLVIESIGLVREIRV